MSSDEFLRNNEELAVGDFSSDTTINKEFDSKVVGGKIKTTSRGSLKTFGAMGFLTALLFIIALVFTSGNFMANTIPERLVEETDVQYADAVESKKIVFQQALYGGEIPDDKAELLKERGVLVGYVEDGKFIENNKVGRKLSLMILNSSNDKTELTHIYKSGGETKSEKIAGEIVTAENFIPKVGSDARLYNVINEATYSRADYYYDETAEKIFQEIGTTRNNYTKDSSFSEVVDSLIGEGGDIKINSVLATENEDGETEYQKNGEDANSKNPVDSFMDEVSKKIMGATSTDATLASADSLKVADTIAKERRASLFYLAFMENNSKMKAGEGNESKINEAMNFINQKGTSEVLNIKTTEIETVTGTPLESPSLYAVMSGKKVRAEDVENYSSDRILKTIENKLGVTYGNSNKTVSAISKKTSGIIGQFNSSGSESSLSEVLNSVKPIVADSIIDNSYETITGINAGELLVEGAVNVGARLAYGSGASLGDGEAVTKYAKLNSAVLAMDAKVDRLNRSPFDVTSKNTFLGAIFYQLAVSSLKFSGSSFFSGLKTFSNTVSGSILALLPSSSADEAEGYLTTFGDCESYGNIGAVGAAQCARNAVFDTTTLDDPFNNPEFVNFVEENTTLDSSGARVVNDESVLADYIEKNNERIVPFGVSEGKNSSSILDMIEEWLGLDEQEKRERSGEAFVNSSSNPDWQLYKWAQRYTSLARATSAWRQFSDDKTALNKIKYFEGDENPVVAYLNKHNNVASR